VVQFVPLKVDTDGANWGQWARKYPPEGNGIPMIYVIRADGEKMYGKTGAMNGEALPTFMKQILGQTGRVFNEKEFALLEKTVEAAKKSLDAGETAAAVKSVAMLSKLGPLGNIGSYAKAAVEADALVKKLTEQGKAKLEENRQKLSGGEKPFEAVMALVETHHTYLPLPELKSDLTAAMRDLNKTPSLREAAEQAQALDRAMAMLDTPSAKSRAAGALKQIVAKWPDAPVAKLAQEQLAKLEPTAVAGEPGKTKPSGGSTGGSSTSGGDAAANAKRAASYLSMARSFAKSKPEKAREYAQKVIDLVPQTAQAREAKALLEGLK
jgi:tetratricopeptide (TPR) repeat protein